MSSDLLALLATIDTPQKGILNFITNINKAGKAKHTKAYLKGRLELLQEYWTRFNNIHDQIMIKATDEERRTIAYFKEDIFFTIENAFSEAKGIISESIEKLEGENCDLNRTFKESPSFSASSSNPLPRISIPSFSGDYLEWPSFRDMFKSLVIDNHNLSNVQRLQYLKTHLTGDAERLLRNLSVTHANFEAAWELLHDRYDNKRILINVLLKSILQLPKATGANGTDMKRLVDGTSDALAALKNLGRPVEQWDDWLLY